MIEVQQGDCRALLPLESRRFDACITDPPFELDFGRGYDSVDWDEAPSAMTYEVIAATLKPDAWLAICASVQTVHRTIHAIELAGLRYVDMLIWLFGQGRPQTDRLKPGWAPIVLAAKGKPSLHTDDGRIGKRHPANVTMDSTVAADLDAQVGILKSGSRKAGTRKSMGYRGGNGDGGPEVIGDSGGPSRFYYCAKVRSNRKHPTQKPVDLMRWIVRMTTRPGDLILDPYLGSGTTLEAAKIEGRNGVGIELEVDMARVAETRVT